MLLAGVGEECLCPTVRKSEVRGERREGREERVLRATWTSYQYLTIILTLFDYFNRLSYDMG